MRLTAIRAAPRYLARVNFEIVKAAGARRQAQDRGTGARAPAALGAALVRLVMIKGGLSDATTPVGYKTARRADPVPRVLADLAGDDPRLMAAQFLGDACERLGSVKGVDWGGTDSKAGASDGGATTRVKHAARLQLIRYQANGWPVDKVHGPQRGRHGLAPRVALEVKRGGDDRQHIMAFDALVAVCVDGLDLSTLLRRHGWSAQASNRAPLRQAILDTLARVADGLGRAAPKQNP